MSGERKEYLEVSMEVAPELQESLSSFLIEIGAGGAWIDGTTVKAFFSPGSTNKEVEEKMAPFFLRFEEEGIEVSSGTLTIRKNRQEDWNQEWKKFFKPVQVSPRLTISPPWEEVSPRHSGDRIILIDPGLGFGTGTHPTTKNCLVFLDQVFLDCSDPAKLRVLDVGSGSGILAIAAAKLGAEYIVAAEIDGDAVESMRHNYLINHVDRQIRLRLGSIFQADRNSYHLVLANLAAEDLIRISHDLQGAILPGGSAILSGILVEKKESVDQAFAALKLQKKDEIIEEKWVTQIWEKSES